MVQYITTRQDKTTQFNITRHDKIMQSTQKDTKNNTVQHNKKDKTTQSNTRQDNKGCLEIKQMDSEQLAYKQQKVLHSRFVHNTDWLLLLSLRIADISLYVPTELEPVVLQVNLFDSQRARAAAVTLFDKYTLSIIKVGTNNRQTVS